MSQILTTAAWAIFFFLLVQVGYLLFFSLAATLRKKRSFKEADTLRRFRIFIPGYKEDRVIIDTAIAAVGQNYPTDLMEVVVIADSFSEKTLDTLRALPIRVVEVAFEKSTKGKALQKAIEATRHQQVDVVVILDADNHMAPGFLHKVNDAFDAGYTVVQGHRTAKNTNTPFALLDACTEEINNHIFRRGHVAAGLPSALIGSGMAFDWNLFTGLLQNIGDTAGEDKELEFRLLLQGRNIAFLDGAYVYDEKVAKTEVFTTQRSRWLAMQVEFLEKYFWAGWIQLFRGNLAFFDKVFQTFLLPRVMLVAALCGWVLFSALVLPQQLPVNLALLAALCLSLLLGIPARWYNRQLLHALLQIPAALLGMFRSLTKIRAARKTFVHTPHGHTQP